MVDHHDWWRGRTALPRLGWPEWTILVATFAGTLAAIWAVSRILHATACVWTLY